MLSLRPRTFIYQDYSEEKTMSYSESNSESSSESYCEDSSDFEGGFEEYEEIRAVARKRKASETLDDVDEGAYQDEPIASDEWVQEKQEELAELESELKDRLSGKLPVNEWCKCGHCDTRNLQNISECYCCMELDGCIESLTSDLVREEVPAQQLTCITQHPGFEPVCLQKWSLRMAADRFKTKDKKRYRQLGSEERYLRSISYREFTRLVYGMLGSKRIPLPSCAYLAIRDAFPLSDSEATHTGFVLEEE